MSRPTPSQIAILELQPPGTIVGECPACRNVIFRYEAHILLIGTCQKCGGEMALTASGRAALAEAERGQVSRPTEWTPIPAPPPCDLCGKRAIWQHPRGGLRCGKCPRPESRAERKP